jgi:hypothetical protein
MVRHVLRLGQVRIGSKTEASARQPDVCLAPESGHCATETACPFRARSRHAYFGGCGKAEEWWSTISQRSPFFT